MSSILVFIISLAGFAIADLILIAILFYVLWIKIIGYPGLSAFTSSFIVLVLNVIALFLKFPYNKIAIGICIIGILIYIKQSLPGLLLDQEMMEKDLKDEKEKLGNLLEELHTVASEMDEDDE